MWIPLLLLLILFDHQVEFSHLAHPLDLASLSEFAVSCLRCLEPAPNHDVVLAEIVGVVGPAVTCELSDLVSEAVPAIEHGEHILGIGRGLALVGVSHLVVVRGEDLLP